jgi:hypothetical protein
MGGVFVRHRRSVFAAAANAVLGAWQKVTSKISDMLLDASAGGGVLGKVVSTILGVDVAEEKRKSEEFDRKRGLAPQDALGDAKNAAREQLAGQAAAGQDIRQPLAQAGPGERRRGDRQSAIARLGAAPKAATERELQPSLIDKVKQAAKEVPA